MPTYPGCRFRGKNWAADLLAAKQSLLRSLQLPFDLGKEEGKWIDNQDHPYHAIYCKVYAGVYTGNDREPGMLRFALCKKILHSNNSSLDSHISRLTG